MKKIVCTFGVLVVLLFGTVVSAHELLPKDLQDFLAKNPNATVEEIQRFAASSSVSAVQEFGLNKDKVLDVLRNTNVGFWDNFLDFVKLGVGHILDGADHILFVLSLLLTFVSMREMLKLTVAFTVAHSITLVLAGAGIITLSPGIVEPIIALSISYVAFTSVFVKRRIDEIGRPITPTFWRSEVPTVFFFGLFHGLGFAGLLEEIQIPGDKFVSSLFAFNIGIELGQLLIVAVALPFIYAVRKRSWYPEILKAASFAMTIVGIYWAIERITA